MACPPSGRLLFSLARGTCAGLAFGSSPSSGGWLRSNNSHFFGSLCNSGDIRFGQLYYHRPNARLVNLDAIGLAPHGVRHDESVPVLRHRRVREGHSGAAGHLEVSDVSPGVAVRGERHAQAVARRGTVVVAQRQLARAQPQHRQLGVGVGQTQRSHGAPGGASVGRRRLVDLALLGAEELQQVAVGSARHPALDEPRPAHAHCPKRLPLGPRAVAGHQHARAPSLGRRLARHRRRLLAPERKHPLVVHNVRRVGNHFGDAALVRLLVDGFGRGPRHTVAGAAHEDVPAGGPARRPVATLGAQAVDALRVEQVHKALI
mmetsp:Transcript_41261/g.78856  ORF Transcript_41261/g.78856 Transcript_41261/m.78856 type:complete len:318 (-) Transcript_41261:1128-2081(-)